MMPSKWRTQSNIAFTVTEQAGPALKYMERKNTTNKEFSIYIIVRSRCPTNVDPFKDYVSRAEVDTVLVKVTVFRKL